MKDGFGYADFGETKGYFYKAVMDAAKGSDRCSLDGSYCYGSLLL